jgi:hypothetical protein
MPFLNPITSATATLSWPCVSPFAVETTTPLNVGVQTIVIEKSVPEESRASNPWSSWGFELENSNIVKHAK